MKTYQKCQTDSVDFTVLYGAVRPERFVLNLKEVRSVTLNGQPCAFTQNGDTVSLSVNLKVNDVLRFEQ